MSKFKHRDKIVYEFLNPQKTDRILSVGCKRAKLELLLLKEIKSLVAFDILKDVIDTNNKKFKNNNKIKFEYGDISKKTHYPSSSFNKVIFLEVIEHLPRGTEIKALKEINRLLKKHGTLVLSTPNHHWFSNLLDPARVFEDHRHYKVDDITNLCQKAGFQVEEIKVVGGIGSTLWIFIRMILRYFKLYSLVENIDNGIAEKIKDKEYSKPGFLNIFIKCKK